MQKFLTLVLLLILSASAYAGEAYWDLDSAVSHVQNSPSVNLISNGSTIGSLSKEYVLKLYEIKRKISSKSGVYPKLLISSSQELNAFATWQNGQPVTIFTLGLLNKIGGDDDAAAAVVAHEFSHLTLQHAKSQQTTNTIIELLAGLALIAIDSSYGGSGRNPYRGLYQAGLDTASNLTLSAYSRSDELAADAQGVKYMIAAGYSPEGAVRLQENIIPSSSSFFRTHPSSESRIKNIRLAANDPSSRSNVATAIVENAIYVPNENVNASTSNTYVDDSVFGGYAKTCEANGLNPKTSQFDVCVFKLKRSDSNSESQKNKLSNISSNLPQKGQVGSIVSIKDNPNYIIFASSIAENLPVGTKIMVATDKSYVNGKVSKFYDGYYLADIENTQDIKQGSRVLIDN